MGVVQMVIYLGGALACEYLNDNTANKSLLYLKISSLAILVLLQSLKLGITICI